MEEKSVFRDSEWQTRRSFLINDVLYDIPLHVSVHGEVEFVCSKENKELVLECITNGVNENLYQIIDGGALSCFSIHEHLANISEVIKEKMQENNMNYEIRHLLLKEIFISLEDVSTIFEAFHRRVERVEQNVTWIEER